MYQASEVEQLLRAIMGIRAQPRLTKRKTSKGHLGTQSHEVSTGDRTILGKISKRGNKILEDAVRAGRTRRPSAAAEDGNAGFVALDRAGIEATPPQHAGDRARQQARPHRLGGSRARSRLSAQDRYKCRVTKARSGPPRGCPPPLGATIAHLLGRASDGVSEGMASRDL